MFVPGEKLCREAAGGGRRGLEAPASPQKEQRTGSLGGNNSTRLFTSAACFSSKCPGDFTTSAPHLSKRCVQQGQSSAVAAAMWDEQRSLSVTELLPRGARQWDEKGEKCAFLAESEEYTCWICSVVLQKTCTPAAHFWCSPRKRAISTITTQTVRPPQILKPHMHKQSTGTNDRSSSPEVSAGGRSHFLCSWCQQQERQFLTASYLPHITPVCAALETA